MRGWLLAVALVAALAGTHSAPPPCPIKRQPVLVVLGGDDAGTATAYQAAVLGIPTLLVLTHRRDLGGDPTSFYHDGADHVPSAGGLAALLLGETGPQPPPHSMDNNRSGGPGDAFLFFDTALRTAPLNRSVEVLSGYVALPGGGQVSADGRRVSGLTLLAHDDQSTCTVSARYVADGTPEGYGAAAFGLPIVFGREAQRNSTDPTLHMEAYAGRRTFSVGGHGPPVEHWSDRRAEETDISSSAGPIVALCRFSDADEPPPLPSQPWRLARPPRGYSNSSYALPASGGFHEGACCSNCTPTVYRFQGLRLTTAFADNTGSTGPALPGWFVTNKTATHYLRASYAAPQQTWALKREVETQAFAIAVGAVYFLQNHMQGGWAWGLCRSPYPAANPALAAAGLGAEAAIPLGPYTLADFDTETLGWGGANFTVAHRLYMRVVARLASLRALGAGQLYGGQPPVQSLSARASGELMRRSAAPSDSGAWKTTKTFWAPDAVSVPTYGTDFTKCVLGNTVPRPAPEASGDGVLMGNGPDFGNFHGIDARVLFPDAALTAAELVDASMPPSGAPQRLWLGNFLSPGAPRTTFILQGAARIGSFAVGLGTAAAAYVACAERYGYAANVSAVPVPLVQYTVARNLSTALTYFYPPLQRLGVPLGSSIYAALMVAGAYGAPSAVDLSPWLAAAGDNDAAGRNVTTADLDSWLPMFAAGIVNGSIPAGSSGGGGRPGCFPEGSGWWYAYAPDWTVTNTSITAVAAPTFHCAAGALLKRCQARSGTLPAADVRCFAPGTRLELDAPPEGAVDGLVAVRPHGLATHAPPSIGSATRGALFAYLEHSLLGNASQAMASPSQPEAGLSLPFLAEVLSRYVYVVRGWQTTGRNSIMENLGLAPVVG